jgi:hypothetical protein
MPIFQGLTDRVYGTATRALQQQVAGDIDRRICQLLEGAIALWEKHNWFTYDREEGNCTVQLYRWCREIKRRDRRFAPLEPHLEWLNVTPAILAGDESVKSANRPDLRIEIGQVSGRVVECKRLESTGHWPRDYVYEGLARFIVGDYGHQETIGYMIGYVQAGPVAVVLTKINKQVAAHPHIRTSQQLKLLRNSGSLTWNTSCHPRPFGKSIQIDHLFINMDG